MRQPPGKLRPDTTSRRENASFNPGRQNHLLSDLKQRYGDNFVGVADANKEFDSRHKMLGLIRTIFSGKFSFVDYGQYLLETPIRYRLGELASSMNFQSQVYALGVQLIITNPAIAAQARFPIDELNQLAMYTTDVKHAWEIINQGIYSLNILNRIDGLIMAVNQMNQSICADGYTKLIKII